jgi:hypothetical protein
MRTPAEPFNDLPTKTKMVDIATQTEENVYNAPSQRPKNKQL